MKSSKRKICQAITLVISALGASVAMAQTAPSLIGGGSSLVAPTIGTEISAFPAADGTISYYSVGSGKGQTAFLNNDPSQFNSGTVTVTGTVDFANSDAPLSSAQISAYTSTGGLGVTNGPLIQIPYIVTPIAIPLVNAPTGTGPALPNSTTPTVALSDDDLCGIFSGKLTDWNQVVNPDNGSVYSATSKPITVIYRADNSGTTDLTTAHLQQVCHTTSFVRNGVTVAANSNITFTESQNFAGEFTGGVPSNFRSATGSGGVAAALLALSGAGVGYLSPDYTNTFLAPSSSPAKTNNLSVASLRNDFTGTDIVPTYQNATTAIGTAKAPSAQLTAKNPANWVPAVSNPTTGYPIAGTSQIIVSQCYANPGSNSPSPAAAVVDFLTQHYSSSNAATLHGNGFDSVPSGFLTAINNDFLSNASTWNLNIGNTTGCSGKVGR
ncbi:substrate-binding domain-containing protein [Paraburkholderia kururiensis]|uniref:Substrate-binding domain-containing protein n=1 Tax=Paraburkholderia kururiensis TaxID=984307 RepID=A0ABZ0WRD4_9BURK|nr:substrate-binding domain-containing protein [Paraburkholderia kururiensis]WQD79940.1 substrate-binding domain-containing protein [Paraburkholderia kururiensis]